MATVPSVHGIFNNVSMKNDDLSSFGDIVISEDADKWKPLKYIR